MGHRIRAASLEASKRLMGRHWPDFLPVLKNPSASRRGLKLCRPRATGRTPACTLMVGIEDLVYAARQLSGVRATFGNRVHLLGSHVWLHRKGPRWMRPNAARLWKPECVAIGDQDCISRHTWRNRLSVVHSASQLPGSRQQFVIPLSGCRLCGCAAEFAVRAASGNCCHDANSDNRYCFDHVCFCIENRPLSS